MLICVFVVFFLTTFRSWTHTKGKEDTAERSHFLPEGIAGKTERDGTDDGKNKTRERSRVVPVGGILPTELEMKKKLVVEVFSTLL